MKIFIFGLKKKNVVYEHLQILSPRQSVVSRENLNTYIQFIFKYLLIEKLRTERNTKFTLRVDLLTAIFIVYILTCRSDSRQLQIIHQWVLQI